MIHNEIKTEHATVRSNCFSNVGAAILAAIDSPFHIHFNAPINIEP